ncbi:MAG: carboxypeptidase-like regulatory domain-containing protein [Paludibacteraceae bacterium]|nr:carboxypeptidase-like regulatory domain-containing protein [Paludibacteraceae bacterium]
MFRGKETCKILKQIRQNIASENDIPLVVEECHYKGDCRGTCPRCEAELEYLERELLKRRSMGKKLVLAGLSVGLSWTPMMAAENIQMNEVPARQDTTENDDRIFMIKGTIMDSDGEPLYGAAVMIQGTTKGVATDFDGNYSIYVKRGDVLEISYIGFKTVTKLVDKIKGSTVDVRMQDATDILGEIVAVCGGIYSSVSLEEATERVRGLKVPENGAELKLRPLIKTDEYRSKDRKRNLKQDILFNKAYPIVKEMKQSVKVKVRFIINEDHSLSDFKIVCTDDERFNEAAMETLKRMDGWQCRQVNGRVVKTRKTVTISYTKEELMRVIELMDK